MRLPSRWLRLTLVGVAVVAATGGTAVALAGRGGTRVDVAETAGTRAGSTTGHVSRPTWTQAPVPTTWSAGAATTAPPPTTAATVATTVPPPTTTPTTSPPRATTTAVPVVARLQIAPSVARFPSLPPPYWPMPIVRVTVTDSGGTAIRSVVVHPVGVYSVPSSTCAALQPGQSCTADVQFCPNSPGTYTNTLVVTGQDALRGSTVEATITLEGTAT